MEEQGETADEQRACVLQAAFTFPAQWQCNSRSAGSVCCQHVSSSVALSNLRLIPKEINRSLNNDMIKWKDFCFASRYLNWSRFVQIYPILYWDLCFLLCNLGLFPGWIVNPSLNTCERRQKFRDVLSHDLVSKVSDMVQTENKVVIVSLPSVKIHF